MTKQLRDKQGRFLPKDAHPEDLHPEWFTRFTAEFEPYQQAYKPPVTHHKAVWRVVIGYVVYLALCFGAGVLGAFLGVKL